MQKASGKILALACAVTVLSSYQLPLGNLDKAGETHAVGLHGNAPAKITDGLSMTYANQFAAPASTAILTTEATIAEATSKPVSASHSGIQPIKGSEAILFSNTTHRPLSGCSMLGVIELHHTGSYEDALVVLRNETYRMKSNWLVPIKASKTSPNRGDSHEIMIEAQMMRCPFKLASSN